MNAKKAKKLRRAAELNTVGKPARGFVESRPGSGVAIVHPQTTRGMYKRFKKLVERIDG